MPGHKAAGMVAGLMVMGDGAAPAASSASSGAKSADAMDDAEMAVRTKAFPAMHLHGMAQRVIAKDGYPVPQPYDADTILVAPGERYTVLVHADTPGVWAWHCHILTHAESEKGMFGMVTAMIVK
jgi:manganese oxidase